MTVQELKERCYTPYSGQPNCAVVQSRSGDYYPGVRIENISFPLTISAVQCAMVVCISEGAKPDTLFLADGQASGPHINFWRREFGLKLDDLAKFKAEPAELPAPPHTIKKQLKALLDRAVVPYSHFPVTALLEAPNGLISGVNLEFGAWESGLCAERVAIAKALAYGINSTDIDALHLHSRHGEYCSPCGACRQVIIEHLPRIPVFIHHPDGSTSRHFSSDLLPHSFTSDFLKKQSPESEE